MGVCGRGVGGCMCVCTKCERSFSAGGSQGLVYRRLETADVFHRGTVRLHRLHVLVEDGEYLVVEDLVLPNAVCHLLQRLHRTKGDVCPSKTTKKKKHLCVESMQRF